MSTAQDTIGKLIEAGQQRDAIHIAMAPVVAAELLRPGQRIAFEAHSMERVRAFGTTIGIVDPFLTEPVKPGQRFWMLLNPNTITSLRRGTSCRPEPARRNGACVRSPTPSGSITTK
jgi:hypothetical protein